MWWCKLTVSMVFCTWNKMLLCFNKISSVQNICTHSYDLWLQDEILFGFYYMACLIIYRIFFCPNTSMYWYGHIFCILYYMHIHASYIHTRGIASLLPTEWRVSLPGRRCWIELSRLTMSASLLIIIALVLYFSQGLCPISWITLFISRIVPVSYNKYMSMLAQ